MDPGYGPTPPPESDLPTDAFLSSTFLHMGPSRWSRRVAAS